MARPRTPEDLTGHNCLLLRYPRSPEFYWSLQTEDGPRKMMVTGKFDTDDGDVLTGWALSGEGIANRPRYEVAPDLKSGRLVEILPDTPPVPGPVRLSDTASAPAGSQRSACSPITLCES